MLFKNRHFYVVLYDKLDVLRFAFCLLLIGQHKGVGYLNVSLVGQNDSEDSRERSKLAYTNIW